MLEPDYNNKTLKQIYNKVKKVYTTKFKTCSQANKRKLEYSTTGPGGGQSPCHLTAPSIPVELEGEWEKE